MKRLKFIGTIAFFLSLPALYFYLKLNKRSRVIVVSNNKVLLLKGWYGSNKWMLPGGGINWGESERAGAIRELYEETKILIGTKQLKPVGRGKINDSYGLKYQFLLYEVNPSETPDIILPRLEISEYKWQDISKINSEANEMLKSTSTLLQTWTNAQSLLK